MINCKLILSFVMMILAHWCSMADTVPCQNRDWQKRDRQNRDRQKGERQNRENPDPARHRRPSGVTVCGRKFRPEFLTVAL